MSFYADACYNIALRCIADADTFGHAFDAYITSDELGYYAVRERDKFDPEHAKRYGGSRRAWERKVWRIADDAWKDAVADAGRPGRHGA